MGWGGGWIILRYGNTQARERGECVCVWGGGGGSSSLCVDYAWERSTSCWVPHNTMPYCIIVIC